MSPLLICLIQVATAFVVDPPLVEIGLPAPEEDSAEGRPPFENVVERIISNPIDMETALRDEKQRELSVLSRIHGHGHNPHLREAMNENKRKTNDLLSRIANEQSKKSDRWTRLGKGNNFRRENSQFTGERDARDEMKSPRELKTYKRSGEGASAVMKPCRLSSEEKKEALDIHRKFRESEHASNMWKMNWDESLAELAQGLSDQCVFKHANLYFPNDTRVGQNLGAIVGANSSITRVVDYFNAEKTDYDFNNHQWSGVVGHYLQLVFWQSTLVGCAKNFCPLLQIETETVQETWKDATFWTCNYWPPVSYKLRPFGDGDKCSKCMVPTDRGLGVKCVEGTCQECKMDGSDSECQDSIDPMIYAKPDADPMCPYAKLMNWCQPYYSWAKPNCQQTCGYSDLVPEKLELQVQN